MAVTKELVIWATCRLVNEEAAMSMTLRDQQRERTRSEILRVAAVEFGRRGYAAVALSEIAAGLEMTKGSVYFNFMINQGSADLV